MSNVVGFPDARATAFARELQWLDAGFANNLRKIRNWPADWFDSESDRDTAINQACRIAAKLHLGRCAAAAKQYGADPTFFETELKNQNFGDTEQMWDGVARLITCGDD
jgi:hypothetical protein